MAIVSPFWQRIPVEFVKKYGRHFSDDVFLNVPNSEQPWKVQLEKDNNDMFLGKGWQLLMDFYSLSYGHFLVFRFDGGLPSQFHVRLLDKSGTEIDYPVRSTPVSKKSTDSSQHKKDAKEGHTEEADDDVSLEKLDEILPKRNKIEAVINLDTSDSDNNVECSSFKDKGYDVISPDMRKNLKKKLGGLKSQYPYFTSIMYPSHVRYKYKLSVPFESHASIYFPSDKSEKIILKGPNGKSHHVGLYLRKGTASFTGGWKDFVVDYDLKAGDGCMFELVKRRSNNTYKVSIFRS